MPSDEDLEAWSRTLPYPLASSLWKYLAEGQDRARVDAVFYVFEAASRYVGILLLSGASASKETFAAMRPGWQGRGAPPSVHMARPTLGSWAHFYGDLAKGVRRQLETNPRVIARAFGLGSTSRLVGLSSRKVGAVLAEVVDRRNTWRGHDADVSSAERRRRLLELAALVHQFREATAGSLDGWTLLQPRSIATTLGATVVEASVLMGPNPRPRAQVVQIDGVQNTEPLLVWETDESRALELLPLIRSVVSEDTGEVAVYFYDRRSGSEVRWLSYDSQRFPEQLTPTPSWLLPLLDGLNLGNQEQIGDEDGQSLSPGVDMPQSDPNKPTGTPEQLAQWIATTVQGLATDLRSHLAADGTIRFALDAEIGHVSTVGRSVHVTAHVPIESAPQLADQIVYEVPASGAGAPATALILDQPDQAYGAVTLLATAVVLARGWSLDGRLTREFMRIADLRPMPTPPRWGTGTRTAAQGGSRSIREIGAEVLGRVRELLGNRPIETRKSMDTLRIRWGPSVDVFVRIDADSTYVGAEVDDRLDGRTRIDHLLAGVAAERTLLRGAIWQRRFGSLLVLDRIGAPVIDDSEATSLDEIARGLVAVATAVGEVPND